MTRRQRYFVKQKLIGLGCITFSIILTLITKGLPVYLVLAPLGLALLFTKEMVWMDDYSEEIEDERDLA